MFLAKTSARWNLDLELDELYIYFEFEFLYVAMLFVNHSSTLLSVFRIISRVRMNLNILMIYFTQVVADLKTISKSIYLAHL